MTIVPDADTNDMPARQLGMVSSKALNSKFGAFAQSGKITFRRNPIFKASDCFFTIGSCFAEEIRLAMSRLGIECVPKYSSLKFNAERLRIDELPRREHLNFYNTYTVRYQFEQMLGMWEQSTDEVWEISKKIAALVPWNATKVYQDPYRRMMIAQSPEELIEGVAQLNAVMLDGFRRANAFVLTYGMTEVFIDKKSGRVVGQKPAYGGGGGAEETVMYRSSYNDNLENVLATIDIIRGAKPAVPIILSVSPVALARTFSGEDVVVANMESKSILRAVLGEVSRQRDGVWYLPSYEYVTMLGLNDGYNSDWRHVRRTVVREIVSCFFSAFFSESVKMRDDEVEEGQLDPVSSD